MNEILIHLVTPTQPPPFRGRSFLAFRRLSDSLTAPLYKGGFRIFSG